MFRRNRIKQEHRQRIVQAFENEDEDYFNMNILNKFWKTFKKLTPRGLSGLKTVGRHLLFLTVVKHSRSFQLAENIRHAQWRDPL